MEQGRIEDPPLQTGWGDSGQSWEGHCCSSEVSQQTSPGGSFFYGVALSPGTSVSGSARMAPIHSFINTWASSPHLPPPLACPLPSGQTGFLNSNPWRITTPCTSLLKCHQASPPQHVQDGTPAIALGPAPPQCPWLQKKCLLLVLPRAWVTQPRGSSFPRRSPLSAPTTCLSSSVRCREVALLHVALKDTGPSILGRQHPLCLITRMQLAGRTVCVLGALAAPMASTPMVVAGYLSGHQARALRNELSCLHEEGKDTQGPPPASRQASDNCGLMVTKEDIRGKPSFAHSAFRRRSPGTCPGNLLASPIRGHLGPRPLLQER